MPPITPESMEKLAQSYAILIEAGEKTIDDVPAKPSKLRPRVEELIS